MQGLTDTRRGLAATGSPDAEAVRHVVVNGAPRSTWDPEVVDELRRFVASNGRTRQPSDAETLAHGGRIPMPRGVGGLPLADVVNWTAGVLAAGDGGNVEAAIATLPPATFVPAMPAPAVVLSSPADVRPPDPRQLAIDAFRIRFPDPTTPAAVTFRARLEAEHGPLDLGDAAAADRAAVLLGHPHAGADVASSSPTASPDARQPGGSTGAALALDRALSRAVCELWERLDELLPADPSGWVSPDWTQAQATLRAVRFRLIAPGSSTDDHAGDADAAADAIVAMFDALTQNARRWHGEATGRADELGKLRGQLDDARTTAAALDELRAAVAALAPQPAPAPAAPAKPRRSRRSKAG